ncbi:uncharacterized protein KY384_005177 [Bacidia gigantensis]|uniref:uncharacterized protein n=1 Tax=Bacidia gigantensis TaxID=2732470 RepID=UPI001D04D84F|nr:uncharacterized protein KY384_005177 [Bacidia gigantensis]KAG8529696.1 hypothetical protein KY384_005177 [Bacidia gigantensis]
MSSISNKLLDKKTEIVFFSATAIALYGYDQGMMSLINTNYDYLRTMGISGESPLVGIIVSVYYLGCAVGAIMFSVLADKTGRRPSIFACLAVSALGNLLMFISGLGYSRGAMTMMFLGRIVMGLGVGGVDSVIPTYSSELTSDGGRGEAMAKEFQSNIFGLNMAFGINLGVTQALGKNNEWAWRIPIIAMQCYPVLLLSIIQRLPESPRWLIFHERKDDAKESLARIYGEEETPSKYEELEKAHEEESSHEIGWNDMIWPGSAQWHQTSVTIMGQVNQALTGYGAVSVYGPQIFELLGLGVTESEHLTQGNYISYFFLMTFAWLLIDRVGRRTTMIAGAFGIAGCFLLLTIFGGLAQNCDKLGIPDKPIAIVGSIFLFIATGTFGVGWLTQPWLIPTEIYPVTSRAQGAAISVIIWGIANFVVTLITPILFNTLSFWLFLIFAVTNTFAAWWTFVYSPETGGRSFEENQQFFEDAAKEKTWSVLKVDDASYRYMPRENEKGQDGENQPLLGGS